MGTPPPAAHEDWRARLRPRLERLLAAMGAGLFERDLPVRLALLAALCGEHLILLGPPGTAKSEVARRLRGALADATYFERLLTRFSVPEELFGPLSLRALERDEYLRLTEGYLPAASVAFLDEIFKANSAILNALLGVLNEREFDNGARRVRVPLVAAVAASNEVPEGDELRALYDRFLLRARVEPVSAGAFAALLARGDEAPPASEEADRLTLADLDRVRAEAAAVRVTGGVVRALESLRAWLDERKIYVSDRRWIKVHRALRVVAFTEGRDAALLPDCWLLPHCVWERPEQLAAVQQWLDARAAELLRDEPARYERLVESYERVVEEESAGEHRRDAQGRGLYHDGRGGLTHVRVSRRPMLDASGEALYRPPGASGERPRGYTAEELLRGFFQGDPERFDRHLSVPDNALFDEVEREPARAPVTLLRDEVERRLAQMDEVTADLAEYIQCLRAQRAEGEAAPLWTSRDAWAPFVAGLGAAEGRLTSTILRLRKVRDRLAAFPRRER